VVEELQQAAQAVISKVFETMFYLWVEPCDGSMERGQSSDPSRCGPGEALAFESDPALAAQGEPLSDERLCRNSPFALPSTSLC